MGNGQRILVVDDELGPREALRMMLKSRYEVMTASGGSEAIELIHQTPPDLVFLDIKMREMNGIEVLKAIKQIDPSIEVVMITAYASLETAREAMTHSASDYLIKPFSKVDVEKAVDKALAHRAEHTDSRQEICTLLEQMRTLAQTSVESTTSQDLVQGATVILEQSKRVLHATAALLHVMEEDGQPLTCMVALDVLDHPTCAFESEAWHGALMLSLTRRVPLRLPAVSTDAQQQELHQALHALGYSACTIFPILAGGNTLGGLSFLYRDTDEVQSDWQERGQTFADLMALTLRIHQRYRASQQEASQQAQRVAQLSILREMTRVIMDNLGFSDMLQAIGEQLQTGLGYAGFSIWLCENGTSRWRQVYASGTQHGWQPRATEDDVPRALRVESVEGTQVVVAPVVLEGSPIGAVELVRDAQHGPVAEFEVELIRMVLDYLGIAIRNSQLHEQLLQSEKMRVLGEMAAGVAHNFNNILTTILGHTQLLLVCPGDEEVLQKGLSTIEKATKDAAQMVRRIQTFARGGQASECQPTDLHEVVKEAAEATRPVWKEQAEPQGKRIEVILKLEPVPAVNSQAAELREVLTNLILNAVDAMPTGGIITLHAQQREEFGCVTVSDTGTGMSEDVQRRIFDPFFTTKKKKGTGLGLSVSHTLIRGHGGDIEMQSTLGRGTTFVIKLPLAPPSLPPVPFARHQHVYAQDQVRNGMCQDTWP